MHRPRLTAELATHIRTGESARVYPPDLDRISSMLPISANLLAIWARSGWSSAKVWPFSGPFQPVSGEIHRSWGDLERCLVKSTSLGVTSNRFGQIRQNVALATHRTDFVTSQDLRRRFPALIFGRCKFESAPSGGEGAQIQACGTSVTDLRQQIGQSAEKASQTGAMSGGFTWRPIGRAARQEQGSFGISSRKQLLGRLWANIGQTCTV